MYNQENISKILRHKRELLNYTQAEIAKLTGFSERAISHYESNKRNVPISYLISFAEVIGLNLQELVGPDEDDSSLSKINFQVEVSKFDLTLTKSEIEILLKLRSLPIPIKDAIISLINAHYNTK